MAAGFNDFKKSFAVFADSVKAAAKSSADMAKGMTASRISSDGFLASFSRANTMLKEANRELESIDKQRRAAAKKDKADQDLIAGYGEKRRLLSRQLQSFEERQQISQTKIASLLQQQNALRAIAAGQDRVAALAASKQMLRNQAAVLSEQDALEQLAARQKKYAHQAEQLDEAVAESRESLLHKAARDMDLREAEEEARAKARAAHPLRVMGKAITDPLRKSVNEGLDPIEGIQKLFAFNEALAQSNVASSERNRLLNAGVVATYATGQSLRESAAALEALRANGQLYYQSTVKGLDSINSSAIRLSSGVKNANISLERDATLLLKLNAGFGVAYDTSAKLAASARGIGVDFERIATAALNIAQRTSYSADSVMEIARNVASIQFSFNRSGADVAGTTRAITALGAAFKGMGQDRQEIETLATRFSDINDLGRFALAAGVDIGDVTSDAQSLVKVLNYVNRTFIENSKGNSLQLSAMSNSIGISRSAMIGLNRALPDLNKNMAALERNTESIDDLYAKQSTAAGKTLSQFGEALKNFAVLALAPLLPAINLMTSALGMLNRAMGAAVRVGQDLPAVIKVAASSMLVFFTLMAARAKWLAVQAALGGVGSVAGGVTRGVGMMVTARAATTVGGAAAGSVGLGSLAGGAASSVMAAIAPFALPVLLAAGATALLGAAAWGVWNYIEKKADKKRDAEITADAKKQRELSNRAVAEVLSKGISKESQRRMLNAAGQHLSDARERAAKGDTAGYDRAIYAAKQTAHEYEAAAKLRVSFERGNRSAMQENYTDSERVKGEIAAKEQLASTRTLIKHLERLVVVTEGQSLDALKVAANEAERKRATDLVGQALMAGVPGIGPFALAMPNSS